MSDDKRIEAFRTAARSRGRWFLVRSIPSDVGYARILIRVAKRVIRTAVGRNRIKRCVREVFRQNRQSLPQRDYLVSVIDRYSEPSLAAARKELERLLCMASER